MPYDRFGPAKDKVRKAGQAITDGLGYIDDELTGLARTAILGTASPKKMGTHGRVKEALVSPFLARPGAADDFNVGGGRRGFVNDYRFEPGPEGQAATIASRALVAGAYVGSAAALGQGLNALGLGPYEEQQSPGAVMPM